MGLTKLPLVLEEIQACEKTTLKKNESTKENDNNLYINDKSIEDENNEASFKITNISGKGMGMIATKKLYPGDAILTEAPLIVVSDDIFEDYEATEKFLDRAVNKLSCQDREAYLSLTDCRTDEDPTYVGILYTNDMNYDGDAAVMPVMARANHSCSPNADFVTRIDQGVQRLYAMAVINIGEEITINYLPASAEGLDNRETRQKYLRTYYGFPCVCKTCSLQLEDLEENEAAREAVKELQSVGLANLPNDDLEDLLYRLLELGCKLSYVLDIVEQLYRNAYESHDEVEMVKYGVKGKNLANIVHGSGSQELKLWEERAQQSNYVRLEWC